MTHTPTRAEVIYEGQVQFSLDPTHGSIEEEANVLMRVRGTMGLMLTLQPTTCGHVLARIRGIGHAAPRIVDMQMGMVKAFIRPEDRWAGLISKNSATFRVYQRIVNACGGQSAREKTKG